MLSCEHLDPGVCWAGPHLQLLGPSGSLWVIILKVSTVSALQHRAIATCSETTPAPLSGAINRVKTHFPNNKVVTAFILLLALRSGLAGVP